MDDILQLEGSRPAWAEFQRKAANFTLRQLLEHLFKDDRIVNRLIIRDEIKRRLAVQDPPSPPDDHFAI